MLKISIITATYNSAATIVNTLDSVLSQSYSNVESIVIDGASTDSTLAKIGPFRERIAKLVSERDQGIYDALNKGIQSATGDIIGFLHSDDVYIDNEVLTKVALTFRDGVDAVYGDLVYVKYDDISKVVRYWKSGNFDARALSKGWMPPHPTFFVRRSVYQSYGGFDTNFKISADYDSILRFLAIHRINAVYIPEILVRMRVGGISNRSIPSIVRKTIEDIRVVRKNKAGGFGTIFLKNVRKLVQFKQPRK